MLIMLERKSVQDKKFIYGQFFTPIDICNSIVAQIDFQDYLVIEPSFGTGNFIKALKKIKNKKIGIELDNELFSASLCDENTELYNMDFYDFMPKTNKRLLFIGNPPFRTPAYSLTTHKHCINKLTKEYGVLGCREEAVFFILHTIDIFRRNNTTGEIHYIIPTSLLKNNSKYFDRFKKFLKEQCFFKNIISIQGSEFDNVTQDLVYLSLIVKPESTQETSLFALANKEQTTVIIDGKVCNLNEYLCLENNEVIPFQKIFKKTFLGSVPCESLLMSVQGESIHQFKNRLCKIISNNNIDIETLYKLLQYNNKFHLKIFDEPFESELVQKKLQVILSYVKNIQLKPDIISEFENLNNYKPIQVRDGTRFYFRCAKLKKNKNFVYELNPNPCKSFYFTGNPSHSSTDYFGYCEYDCNRNVSPGANRTVPIDGIEDNLTENFKKWWKKNTSEPLSNVFEYLIYISRTQWYKDMKKNNKRFYFAIPKKFIPLELRKI